jgi:hypothetical protein
MKIEALPIGLKFSIANLKFNTNVQYDIYGDVSIFIFNEYNETIAELTGKNAESVKNVLGNYVKKNADNYNYSEKETPKTVKKIVENLTSEIKEYNKNITMAKTTKKPAAKKAAKKPSPAQLAAREKFAAMAKAKAKAVKAKKPAAKKVAAKKTASKTYQTGSSNKLYDKMKKSQGPGKRVSATGNVYYERRKNRSDMPGSVLGIGNINTNALQNLDYLIKELSKAEKTRDLMKATKGDKTSPYYKALIKYIAITKKQISLAKQAIK